MRTRPLTINQKHLCATLEQLLFSVPCSVQQLSRLTGFSASSISRMARGGQTVSPGFVDKLPAAMQRIRGGIETATVCEVILTRALKNGDLGKNVGGRK